MTYLSHNEKRALKIAETKKKDHVEWVCKRCGFQLPLTTSNYPWRCQQCGIDLQFILRPVYVTKDKPNNASMMVFTGDTADIVPLGRDF